MGLKHLLIPMMAVVICSCEQKNAASRESGSTKSDTTKYTSASPHIPTQTSTDYNKSGTASKWLDIHRDKFVEACANSAASLGDRSKSYCECSQEKVEKLYPDPADVSKLTKAQTNAIAKDCLK